MDKVWYDNASVWRREKDGMTEYEPNNLHRSPELTMLRSIAGEMASGYPDQQNGLWLCVCGRPNLDGTPFCARCHQDKAEVFARYSREAVQSAAEARDSAMAAKGRETLQKTGRRFADEKDFVRRKPKLGWLVKLAAALVILAVAGLAFYQHGVPHVEYQFALLDMEAAELNAYEVSQQAMDGYQAAEEAFLALGDYRDAKEQALACRYARAVMLYNVLDEESQIEAKALFTSLGDYKDAAGYLPYCDMNRVANMRGEGRLIEARDLCLTLQQVPGFEDTAAATIRDIDYDLAKDMLNNGDYLAARSAFAALGDYLDSKDWHLRTWYMPAVQAMQEGDADRALALFAEVPGFQNTDELVKQIHYEKGVALRAEGKNAEAAEAFYLAIGYKDAADQANECFYGPASIAFETLDYEQAASLFAKILDYRDAREKWQLSIYESARKALKEIDYAKAASLLGQLPADYQDTASLLLDCTYLPAMNAYVRGDYEEAIAGFAAVPGHKDADSMALRSKYDWAGKLHETGDLDEAAALYTELAAYEDAAARLTAVRYDQANALMTAADAQSIEKAMALYAQLGAYEDSALRLEAATTAKAEALLTAGQPEEARALFAAMPPTETTAERIRACDYAIAAALAKDGKTEEALAAFTALGDYSDAPSQELDLR